MAGQTPEWLSGAFETAQGYGDPGDAMGMQGNRDAQEALNQRYKQMHANFQAYRPEHANSRMNALNQQLGAFGPINDLIQRMYGQGAGIDLAALGRNPMTAGAMLAGQSAPEETTGGGSELPFGLDPKYLALGALHGPEAYLTQPVVKGLRSTRPADPAKGEIGYGLERGTGGPFDATGSDTGTYVPTYFPGSRR